MRTGLSLKTSHANPCLSPPLILHAPLCIFADPQPIAKTAQKQPDGEKMGNRLVTPAISPRAPLSPHALMPPIKPGADSSDIKEEDEQAPSSADRQYFQTSLMASSS